MSGSHRSRSLLLVSYFYPPTRDTGAQRPAAMAKWLARSGWDVTVLTTSAFGDAEPAEPAAGDDPAIRVIRSRDLQTVRARLAGHSRVDSLFDSDSYSGKPHPLSKLIVPEPLAVAWTPFARRAAFAAHREHPFDCVLTTSPPESAHTIGHAFRRRGVPWVADIRDAWTFEPLRPAFPTGIQRHLDERLERHRLGAADRVVCVSEPAAADLRDRGIADPLVIANAWDPDQDPGAGGDRRRRGPARRRTAPRCSTPAASAATAATRRRWSRRSRRSPAARRELAGRLELAIAGPLQPAERALFERPDLQPVKVTLLGSLERETTLALQRTADALLLLAQPARSQLVNFKLFEYLAAGVPILALAAGTEAGRLAAEAGIAPIVAADDPEAIATALAALLGGDLTGPDPAAASRFSYPAAAEAMSKALGEALTARLSSETSPRRCF